MRERPSSSSLITTGSTTSRAGPLRPRIRSSSIVAAVRPNSRAGKWLTTTPAGTSSTSLSKLFANGTGSWAFAPQIDIPIFSGGRNIYAIQAVVTRKNIGIANYEKAIQTGFREVADSLASRSGLDERIAATESLVAAQQKRTELATARYERGLDSYFEVLTATLDFYTARQSLIQLRLARNVSSVNLYKALGGGW